MASASDKTLNMAVNFLDHFELRFGHSVGISSTNANKLIKKIHGSSANGNGVTAEVLNGSLNSHG